MNKFFITTPIYYVNSQPHIGHAYTTVAVDVLARYHRLKGEQVFFLTGTDEHGAKICQAAQKAGHQEQKFCDLISEQFKQVWRALNIDYSYFIRTTDREHEKGVVEFLTQLKDEGFLYEADYGGLYCVGCEKFMTEKELIDGRCPDHQREPEKISEKNWFFKLKEFLPRIEKLITDDQILIQPANAKKEVLGLFKQGLEDFSVSRQNVSWGIKLPWDQSQTIYVWVDALLNYWTALQNNNTVILNGAQRSEESQGLNDNIQGSFVGSRSPQDDLRHFWPPDLHIMSHDILKFHAVYWPAMLLAAGLALPRQIFIHGYFTINGQKMSKTIGNVIVPQELIKKFGVDATRYLLLAQFPFGNDGDISLDRMIETYNAHLANGLGNLVARVAKFGFKIQDSRFKNNSEEQYQKLMADLDLYGVVKLAQEKIQECDGQINKIQPWKIKDKPEQEKVLKPIIKEILFISRCLAPIMLTTSQKIVEIFKTGQSEILFPRII